MPYILLKFDTFFFQNENSSSYTSRIRRIQLVICIALEVDVVTAGI